MRRVLIWYSVHKRQWRLVYWFAVATLRRSGIRLNEGRGMKMRHYLTKVGAVCDGRAALINRWHSGGGSTLMQRLINWTAELKQ